MNHPAGQFTRQARAPTNTDLCAATTPVIAHTRCRADQRIAIRRMGNRAMNLTADAQLSKNRHPVQAFFKPGHDPVIVRGE